MITAVQAYEPKEKSSQFPGFQSPTEGSAPSPSNHKRRTDRTATIFKTRIRSAGACRSVPLSDDGLNQRSESALAWKRCLDLTCIAISLPLVLPLMLLVVLWIRLVSRGPALFRQERIGQDGRRFVLYKFRSMKMNAGTCRHETYLRHLVKSDSPMIKLDLLCDSRLIPGGCLLRAAGIDELPQLLNVLRGEMSLVGPRPCLPQEYAYFSAEQRGRFKVLPGLTGSWQVSGKNQSTFTEMNRMDLQYARSASILLDLRIMARTPSVLLHQLVQAAQHKFEARQIVGSSRSEAGPECSTQRIG